MTDPSAACERSNAKRARARTRQAPRTGSTGPSNVPTGTVTGPEQHHLAAGVGALLKAERVDGEWTVRELASRIGAAHTTVLRLEAGTRRPSPAMLASLARVLSLGDAEYETDLYARLVDAAGASMAADTPGGQRRRARRMWRIEQERRRDRAAQERRERARQPSRTGSSAAGDSGRTLRLMAVLTEAFDGYERVAAAIASGRLAGPQLAAAETEYIRLRDRLDALLPTNPQKENPDD
ncbi:helix-turn-helix transcriptional regulator [Yinghuangia sp. ASG 101]|uniref:helix-turn-helix domain-containing protein n=1 Tax=Yinghuangia sp. ASG 101 TaxID=2896848 RepID=UPI001E3F0409|nr:helix-turn-helix transcriptional regulator [Yinghuangia sp. ASG 101]UGQ15028.1 helix-turn-helix transcriptional regulator [Yinghuangia sp. ASG 101]